jgi:hypothetical protein
VRSLLNWSLMHFHQPGGLKILRIGVTRTF